MKRFLWMVSNRTRADTDYQANDQNILKYPSFLSMAELAPSSSCQRYSKASRNDANKLQEIVRLLDCITDAVKKE